MGDEGLAVIYLTAVEVIAVHAEALGGGEANAAKRLRSPAGLDGAVARPQHHAHYAGADLAIQAAVLAHGIAEGQVFLDGNKRTALLALATFLRVNGYRLIASQDERSEWILELAAGGSVDVLAAHIRDALAPLTT